MGLKVPGVSWPLVAAGNLLMGANRVTFSDVGLVRTAAGTLLCDDGAGGNGIFRCIENQALNGNYTVYNAAGSANYLRLEASSKKLRLSSDAGIGFSGTAGSAVAALDAGIIRAAAGRLLVDNGAGAAADLSAAFVWHPNETAPGAAAATLNNAPAGAAGNPDKWLQVKDSAGTVHVIPAWTP